MRIDRAFFFARLILVVGILSGAPGNVRSMMVMLLVKVSLLMMATLERQTMMLILVAGGGGKILACRTVEIVLKAVIAKQRRCVRTR